MVQNESLYMPQEVIDKLYAVPSGEQGFNFSIGKGIRLMVLAPVMSFSQVSFADDCMTDSLGVWEGVSPEHIQEEYPLASGSVLQIIPSCENAFSCYVEDDTMAGRGYRLQSLLRSFHRNAGEVEAQVQKVANSLLDRLADVAFMDDIVQYDAEQESVTARLDLGSGYDVSVTQFADEENVLFSLFHGRKLLVSDEMDLDNLVERLNNVVAKLSVHA